MSSSQPSYLARGRGNRGRSNNKKLWGKPAQATTTQHKDQRNGAKIQAKSPQDPVEERFQNASASIQDSLQHHMEMDQYSSSDEEDINYDKILEATYKTYKVQLGDVSSGDILKQQLHENCQSKTNVCLICIENIKQQQEIWPCQNCHCILHLQCIQKWAREGAVQKNFLSEDNFPQAEKQWLCPNCRFEYKKSECPSRYICYCGKEVDPKPDPWLTPHTCGHTCEKPLQPRCIHQCLLLCHPGACPPCPKTISVSCHCGNQPPTLKRCSARQWSCGQPCGHQLTCGHHTCKSPCHAGECSPCPQKSEQPCKCGQSTTLRPCASPAWQCTAICNQVLSCSNHTCEEICHVGLCSDCPRAGDRSCPCGKTKYQLPCTDDVPTCGDTCDQMLQCGLHHCTNRCHSGACETCRQMSVKQCQCGLKEKSVPCSKTFLCEVKCSVMRDCGRHQCKRKCCGNHCPACEQTCGRNLACKNHKCLANCHTGLCYPCREISVIKCNCGVTVQKVHCGMERSTKPPRCRQICSVVPDCHHSNREPHRCHFGRCPPCKQLCDKQLLSCKHHCPKACHDAVFMKQVEQRPQPAGPWEKQPEVQFKLMSLPCPPCLQMLPVECLGKHQIQYLPCSQAVPFSCKTSCGRLLSCGNHMCQLDCHKWTGAENNVKTGCKCMSCEEGCNKPQLEGCPHKCRLSCHSTPCPTCNKAIKMRCHCRNMLLYVKCSEWTSVASDREEHQSCKGSCPMLMGCGHLCSKSCHSGDCTLPSECTAKAPLKCPCKRRKKNFPCPLVKLNKVKLECDENCKQIIDKQKRLKEDEELKKEMDELKRKQKDEEEFNRFMHKGKKHKRKKKEEIEVVPWWKNTYLTMGVILLIAVLFSIYFMTM